MHLNLANDWKKRLKPLLDKPTFVKLWDFVTTAYQNEVCYPPKNEIFNAFNHCSFENLQVVIIGQDPYHGKGQADGLCFSVHKGIKHPPSLRNIFKELEADCSKSYPESGDLEAWAKQGVLLLNATLTVEEGKAGSHQKKGWEQFTDEVIRYISAHKNDIVFLLWGSFAQKKIKIIDTSKHHVLTSGHPSPLSANRGYWFGNKHFSKTNLILEQLNKKCIEW